MEMGTVLRMMVIGVPLAGILLIGLLGEKHNRARQGVTIIFLTFTAISALSLFLAKRYFACALATGIGNCIEESLILLLLIAGSIALSFRYLFAGRIENPGGSRSHISALLLVGAPAALLFDNLLLWFIAWYALSYVIYRSLRNSGLHWGFFMIHDDYRDDAITRRK